MLVDVVNYPSPEAADATVVYAVGDIHGRLDLLLAMESLIAGDIAETQPSRAVICYLGDYIDRGPQSAQVIDYLSTAAGGAGEPARVFLKGNHEDRMLAFLSDTEPNPDANGAGWLNYGGREALASYSLSIPDEPHSADWLRLRDTLNQTLPAAHLHFLHTLRLAFVWQDTIFVHAGLNPARPLEAQHAHDLMWIREPFLTSSHIWSHRIVHGHVVVAEPEFHPNRIAIDTGASRTGRLTTLVVSHAAPRLLHAMAH